MDEEEKKGQLMEKLFGMSKDQLENDSLLDMPKEKLERLMFLDSLFGGMEAPADPEEQETADSDQASKEEQAADDEARFAKVEEEMTRVEEELASIKARLEQLNAELKRLGHRP